MGGLTALVAVNARDHSIAAIYAALCTAFDASVSFVPFSLHTIPLTKDGVAWLFAGSSRCAVGGRWRRREAGSGCVAAEELVASHFRLKGLPNGAGRPRPCPVVDVTCPSTASSGRRIGNGEALFHHSRTALLWAEGGDNSGSVTTVSGLEILGRAALAVRCDGRGCSRLLDC
jgi:hypothetical protein